MKRQTLVPALVAILAVACGWTGPLPTAPVITAQGFDIAEPRTATVSEFGDVRLRLEVAGRIDEIRIAERGFDADLAQTLDRDLFRLFGLAQRPYGRKDVTLNLRNYLNERISAAGDYRLDIAVTDYAGRSAAGRVLLTVQMPVAAPEAPEPVAETADFTFQRVGPGSVRGANGFGITWKTVDPIRVTIRVAADAGGATKIARIDANAFRRAQTRAEVAELVEGCTAGETIEFDTANAAATGEVFAVLNEDRPYILQASASETILSEAGTTVVVTGSYKY